MDVNVKLNKEHTHRGVHYAKGSTLKVSKDQSEWLEKHKIAEVVLFAKASKRK